MSAYTCKEAAVLLHQRLAGNDWFVNAAACRIMTPGGAEWLRVTVKWRCPTFAMRQFKGFRVEICVESLVAT